MPKLVTHCRRCRAVLTWSVDSQPTVYKGQVYHRECFVEWLEDKVQKMRARDLEHGLKPHARAELKDLLAIRKVYVGSGELPPLE